MVLASPAAAAKRKLVRGSQVRRGSEAEDGCFAESCPESVHDDDAGLRQKSALQNRAFCLPPVDFSSLVAISWPPSRRASARQPIMKALPAGGLVADKPPLDGSCIEVPGLY